MHEAAQKAEFDLLTKSQFWPAERIRDLQRERLEMLLRHAKAHVPFYSSRLDVLFRSDGSIDWDRWAEVPIVRREDLLQHRRAMLARTVPAGHEQISDISTSGSTGKPATTSHSKLAAALSKAAVFRANVNDGVDFGARLGMWDGLSAKLAAWPEGGRAGRWGPWWDAGATDGEVFTINHLEPAERVLEFMRRKEVRYLICGGMDARLLAHEAERLGIALSLDAILTRGTDTTAEQKAHISEVFGARTLPLYSSKEGHRMAHRCPQCGQWHVNDEQVLLEIVDSDGLPIGAGQTGRVVVTPVFSYAQPLIRYDQGDLAKRAAVGRCARVLSSIEEIVGRVRHMFVMPDGSRIVPSVAGDAIAALNATMFQIAQIGDRQVEVRHVPRTNGHPSDTGPVSRALAAVLHPEVAVTFRMVEAFDVPPGRKHIEYVNELE